MKKKFSSHFFLLTFALMLCGIPSLAHGEDATSHLTIRYQDSIIFDDDVVIPTSTTFTYTDATTNETITTTTAGYSVLDLFNTADANSEAFNLTNISYYSSFDSFIINCIHLNQGDGTDACYNWKYVVNSFYPFVGMNAYKLTSGELVYLYFGDQYNLSTDKSTYETNESVQALFQEYDYVNNGWNPVSDTEILATDPIYPDWSNNIFPTTLASDTTNESGNATFNFTTTGTVFISLNDTFSYWPSKSITIIDPTPTTTITTTTEENTENNSGGNSSSSSSSGSSSCCETSNISQNLINFLDAKQNPDGSFGSSAFLNDWAAIAYGSWTSTQTGKTKLLSYLMADPSPLDGPNQTTNYARRAMGLMSLGINPYTGTKTNYIQAILNGFDGNQFGDTGLVNDDIFALIPLTKAGYTASDALMVSTTKNIIANQSMDGSFGSVDLTAAAIQALTPLSSQSGVTEALAQAKNYLHASQQTDGGFGDIYGTSWAIQAISSLGENQTNWVVNGNTPLSYIIKNEAADGGLLSGESEINRIWSTASAIPGVMGKSWNTVLSSFDKPTTIQAPSSGGVVPDESTSSTPPLLITTSTLIITTTTQEIIEPTTTTTIATSTEQTPTIEIKPATKTHTIYRNSKRVYTPSTTQSDNKVLGEKIEIVEQGTLEPQKNSNKKYIFLNSLVGFLEFIGNLFKNLITSKK